MKNKSWWSAALVAALCVIAAYQSPAPITTGPNSGGSGSGGPPTGAAGGALSGTYPNPGLAATLPAADAHNLTNLFTKSLTNVFYVSVSGNDTTAVEGDPTHPWLTPNAALTAANAQFTAGVTNNMVLIGVGTFDLGTNLMQPTNNVVICGAGPYSTWILSEVDSTTNGPTFALNANVVLCNMSIAATLNNGTNYQYNIGIAPSTPSTNWVNGTTAYVYNVDTWGWSDNYYFNVGANNLTNTVYMRNINTHSGWDSVVVSANNNTCTNFVCDIDGFTMNFTQGLSAINGAGYRGLLVANGTLRARNGVILFPAGTAASTNTQVAIRSGAGTTASASLGIFENIGIANNLGTNVTSTTYADIYSGAGTVNKKSQLLLGNIYRIQGSDGSATALAIQTVAAGSTSTGITWIPNIDPSQITEPTYSGGFVGTPLSLPTRAVNLGGTVTITNSLSCGLENVVSNIDVGPLGIDTTNNAVLTDHGSFATAMNASNAAVNLDSTWGTLVYGGSGNTATLETVTNNGTATNHINGRYHTIRNISTTNNYIVVPAQTLIDGIVTANAGQLVTIPGQTSTYQADTNSSIWRKVGGTSSMFYTNWVSGVTNTNVYGGPIIVSGNIQKVITGVNGNASMELRVVGLITNTNSLSSVTTSLGATNNDTLSITVPTNAVYVWSNTSAGAGDSTTVGYGQITVLP